LRDEKHAGGLGAFSAIRGRSPLWHGVERVPLRHAHYFLPAILKFLASVWLSRFVFKALLAVMAAAHNGF
jgi:hypothetical protein